MMNLLRQKPRSEILISLQDDMVGYELHALYGLTYHGWRDKTTMKKMHYQRIFQTPTKMTKLSNRLPR